MSCSDCLLVEEAVFSDCTCQFVQPCEPEIFDTVTITIRLAAANSAATVELHTDLESVAMKIAKTTKEFVYFQGEAVLSNQMFSYWFEIHYGEKRYFYDKFGLTEHSHPDRAFQIMPGFHTPAWAKGAVMYQIFVDRFYNGDVTNDVQTGEYYYLGQYSQKVEHWSEDPKPMDVQSFYGGDLKGVQKKLDYLQGLGVEVLYLNPIFVSPSNHKYDIQDYDYIDPHYGVIVKDDAQGLSGGDTDNRHSGQYVTRVTDLANLEASNDFFAEFMQEVHARGMKVILDGVFNHCGSFNKWLDRELIYSDAKGFEKGAYESESSPYVSFFQFHEEKWPNNKSYDGWWGHDTLPKLNYEASPKLYQYIMRIARKWVSPPYNVDGWRLDVAADLGHSPEYNHKFWHDFRKNVKAANPEALILAEHYGDPSSWLAGDQWDSVMNYDAFMEPVTWFLTGMQKHSDQYQEHMLGNEQAFHHAMRSFMKRFQTSSLQVAMNQLSNHDHSRFLTRTNQTVGRLIYKGARAAEQGVNFAVMRQAVLMQMTWPGAPTIYYGDEAGLCGWTDPDNRRTYPWGKENQELIQYHRELIRIHKDYQAFRTGSVIPLYVQNGVVCYGRFDWEAQFVVAVNSQKREQLIRIPVWKLELTDKPLVRLLLTDEHGFWPDACIYHPEDGYVTISLPAKSGILLKNLPW